MTSSDTSTATKADSVIIVTGASSGIGRATALLLAAQGMRVVLAARDRDRLAEVRSEIGRSGGEALICPTDMRDRSQIDRLVSQALEAYGRIDGIVVNAGTGCPDGLCTVDDETLIAVLETNLTGAIRCIHAVLPEMLSRKSGRIVVVGSVTAILPWPGDAVYSTSKAALSHLVRRIRREVHGTGITVSEVIPGVIDTPLSAGLSGIPKASPEVVARAVLRCLRTPVKSIVVPRWYRWLFLAHLIAPGLVEDRLHPHEGW